MKSNITTGTFFARVAAVLMGGLFVINVYIGLNDTNLQQLSPLHNDLNWVIAVADLVAAIFLVVKAKSIVWRILAGVIWPLIYVSSLFIDVETRLCIGASATSCFPTVINAYNYLILGSASEEWVLWPYTIRVAIILAVAVLALSLLSLSYFRAKSRKNTKGSVLQNSPITTTQVSIKARDEIQGLENIT